ncbi:MAG: [LysW]-aminoadipate/[LysW]-glutamate kinase [Candidatus Odinarchaeia archaeon]
MRIVTKIGGTIILENLDSIAKDTAQLTDGNEIIYVHGGAKIVNEISEKMGKKPEFIVSPSGSRSRYTDKETIEIFEMAMSGRANKNIVRAFINAGLKAVGLTGIDGEMIIAKRKKKLKVKKGNKILLIEGGYTGKVQEVDPTILDLLVKANYIPVIASLAIGLENEPLNIDADRAAANVAGAVKADVLLLLTDVPGVLDNKGNLIKHIKFSELDKVRSEVGFGMEKKILATKEALERGVKKVLIASGKAEKPLSEALTEEGCTVVTNE